MGCDFFVIKIVHSPNVPVYERNAKKSKPESLSKIFLVLHYVRKIWAQSVAPKTTSSDYCTSLSEALQLYLFFFFSFSETFIIINIIGTSERGENAGITGLILPKNCEN